MPRNREALKDFWSDLRKTQETTGRGSYWPKIRYFDHLNMNYYKIFKNIKHVKIPESIAILLANV